MVWAIVMITLMLSLHPCSRRDCQHGDCWQLERQQRSNIKAHS